MSIPVLVQVQEEVRRLAIAGGAVASGDFRLKKLLPALEQAGGKVPVFARVAHAAQAVVESTEKTASAALLDLATLVHAIMYTQGETGLTGELTPIPTTATSARRTQVSARVLKPLLEALSTTGSGRIELIRDAVERGAFNDLRLFAPALNGLDDPYPEIAQLLAESVIPLYGKAAVPELKVTLNLKGRAGHLHRLRLLHTLDPEGTRDTIRQALESGSKEIKVVAIACLGTDGDNLNYLLEQTKAKAREVRAAALGALSKAATLPKEGLAAIRKALEGDDLALIVDQLPTCPNPEVLRDLLAVAEPQLAATLAEKDPKKQGEAITRLQLIARSLMTRSEAETEAFLLRCFDAAPAFSTIKSTPSGKDFNILLAEVLASGTPTMCQRLVATHRTLAPEMLTFAYSAAGDTMTPAAFFDEFSPILSGYSSKPNKKGGRHEAAAALADLLCQGRYYGEWDPSPRLKDLDPRWLDAAVDADAIQVACALARPGHEKLNEYMSKKLAGIKHDERMVLLRAMVSAHHPAAADSIIDCLRHDAKGARGAYFSPYWYGELIAALPRTEYPKFETAMTSLPEKIVDCLMDSVLELKNKPE